MMKRIGWILLLGLVACGDDEPPAEEPDRLEEARLKVPPPAIDSVPGADTIQAKGVRVFARDNKITVSTQQLALGDVDFTFENTEDQQHIFELKWERGARWRTLPVGKGGRVVMTARLEPGLYELSCAVPGHKDKGENVSLRAGPKPEPVGPVRIRPDTQPQLPQPPAQVQASRVP